MHLITIRLYVLVGSRAIPQGGESPTTLSYKPTKKEKVGELRPQNKSVESQEFYFS